MQKYGQMNLFPVKLQVPIILTVYLVLVNKCAFAASVSRPAVELFCSRDAHASCWG